MRLDLGLLGPAGATRAPAHANRSTSQRRQLLRLIDTLALVLSLPLALESIAALQRAGGSERLVWAELAVLLCLWAGGAALIAVHQEQAAFAAIFGLGQLVVLLQMWHSSSIMPGAVALPALVLGAVALPVGPLLLVLASDAAALLAIAAAHDGISAAQALAACTVLSVLALAFGALGNRFRSMLRAASEAAEQLKLASTAQARSEHQQRLHEAHQQVLRHDLRSPCDILAGYVELMQQGALSPEQTSWTLQQVKVQTLRLRMRVDALVDEAKAPGRTDWDEIDIAALLRAHARDLRRLAASAPRETAAAPPQVHVDVQGACLMRGRAQELQRIFENLVANSATAGAANVWISAQVGRNIQISIKDDGPGYPDGLVGSVLKPSYAERPPGIGLGLVGVAANVAAFGGAIELGNWRVGPDGGACTTLRFPCA